jgi:hypothetical protein
VRTPKPGWFEGKEKQRGMFAREKIYLRARRYSAEEGRLAIQADQKKLWRTDEACADGVRMLNRSVYAQNDAYLEVCNPGLERNWLATWVFILAIAVGYFFIYTWFGVTIRPFFTGTMSMFWHDVGEPNVFTHLFGWVLLFPIALIGGWLIYAVHFYEALTTVFFAYPRGRIRFNRITRKVYVLRPKSCGGNVVFDWPALQAILDVTPYSLALVRSLPPLGQPKALVLYRAGENDASGDDAIFVGSNVEYVADLTGRIWEYIRCYMETGPTADAMPPNASLAYSCVPRHPPQDYFTFCGLLSSTQYRLERKPRFYEYPFFQLSQLTCRWPRFPKEWARDGGVGEPEDRPVQAGTVSMGPL